jgi:hypothetical protein
MKKNKEKSRVTKRNKNNYRKLTIFFLTQKFQEWNKDHKKHKNQLKISPTMAPKFGVPSQATKYKSFTSENICSSASKGRSHREYLA